VPAPPDAAVTQPGDLWILGNHRLLCGDSSKPEDLDRLLGGKTIQLVNTDPPYNVKVEPRSNNAIAAGLSSFSNDSASQKLKGGQGNAASFGVDLLALQYGLPIAARNVAAHGGLLRLESREDEGTTVTILLPRESQ
jgi:hypothetical protein